MTMLSPHFSLAEMTISDWALRHGVPNEPGPAEIAAMQALCAHVLEPVRAHFGPVHVNSGYRAPAVNAGVGGVPTSQHVKGQAADIEVAGIANFELANWIFHELDFDQVILEYYHPGQPSSGWVHVSWAPSRRAQALTKVPGEAGYRSGLWP